MQGRLLLLCTLLVTTGCGPSDEDADRTDPDGTVNEGTQDIEQENAAWALEVDWGQSKMTFDIFGGLGAEFYCGMAETGSAEGWLEESCVESRYCHPCGTTGVELLLGGNPDSLNEGFETAFTSAGVEPGITYYIENRDTHECWIWGNDVRYYRVTLDMRDCEIYSPAAEETAR